MAFDVAVQACFIVAVLLAYVLLFIPMIRQLDAMLKRTRGMLLLFPDEVINGVAAVSNMFSQYSKMM